MRQTSEVIVLVTTKTASEAKKLGKTVVGEQLAACVNIIRTCKSLYRWNGKVQESAESLLIIKTTLRRYQDLQRRIKSLHSYTVPEVVAISISQGLPAYLAWIRKSVHK